MESLKSRLLRKEAAVCVWGLGYVGYSSACFWASRGVWVIGVELDRKRGEAIRAGKCPVEGFDVWLKAASVDPSPGIEVFGSSSQIPDRIPVGLHCIAVPTEIGGKPFADALLDVCQSIAYRYGQDAIVMIESTVSPKMIDAVVEACPKLRLVAAPRRDWFDSPDKHLGTLPRLIGADDSALLEEVRQALSIVCEKLIPSTGLRKTALVKVVENDLRHVELIYANDLARTISDEYDVREILELASSKWNIPLLRPSIGIGGACIPLAGRYLREIGDSKASQDAQRSAEEHLTKIVHTLAGYKRIAFHGIGYKSTAPYVPSSPATWILEQLYERQTFGVDALGVFAAPDEVEPIKKRFPKVELLREEDFGGHFYQALVIPVGTMTVRRMHESTFRKAKPYEMLLDNEAALSHLPDSLWSSIGTRYVVPGRRGWLSSTSS